MGVVLDVGEPDDCAPFQSFQTDVTFGSYQVVELEDVFLLDVGATQFDQVLVYGELVTEDVMVDDAFLVPVAVFDELDAVDDALPVPVVMDEEPDMLVEPEELEEPVEEVADDVDIPEEADTDDELPETVLEDEADDVVVEDEVLDSVLVELLVVVNAEVLVEDIVDDDDVVLELVLPQGAPDKESRGIGFAEFVTATTLEDVASVIACAM